MKRNMTAGSKRLIAVFLLISVSTASAGTFGKLAGCVTDSEGNPFENAYICVDDVGIDTYSDTDGYFFILNTPPGLHVVSAHHVGCQSVIKTEVLVIVDLTTEVDFTLQPKAIPEDEVVITAERSEIKRDATSTRQSITSEELKELPVTTVDEALELQTGVIYSEGSLHVRGGRYGELAYLVDGHRIEDPLYRELITEINAGAVEQMDLLTGTFNAEFGNAMSGVLNIATKAVPTSYSGNVRYRMSGLGIEKASDNLNERFIEGTVGGPLLRGTDAGFLLSGRLIRKDNYYESGILGDDGQPTGELSGEAFGYSDKNNLFAKVSFQPFANGKAEISYNLDDREWMNYVHSFKYVPDSAYVRTDRTHWIGINLTHTVRNDLFYEVRGSYYQEDYLRTYAGLLYNEYLPEVLMERDHNFEFYLTSANLSYLDLTVRTLAGTAALNWQVNRHHLVKLGAEFRRHDLDNFWIYYPRRSEEYQYINDYRLFPYEGSAYFQDKIEFESLVVNAGLRLDFYHPRLDNYIANPNDPEGSRMNASLKTQLSPRIGIAYPVTDRTVFHFAYGHFFQRPPFDVMYEDLGRKLTVWNPLIGDPDLKPERTHAYEFGLSARPGSGLSIQLAVFSKEIRDLVGIAWQLKEPGVPIGYAYYTNEDFASVRGLELKASMHRGAVRGVIDYTFSIAEGSGSTRIERYYGYSDIIAEQPLELFPLDFDQRHTINATLTYNIGNDGRVFGMGMSVFKNMITTLLFRYGSGFPFTYNPSRLEYVPDLKNARKPCTYSFDVKARKQLVTGRIDLGIFLEILNLLNRKNVKLVYTATGKPDDSGSYVEHTYEYDNDPTHYCDPRTIYMGFNLALN